MPKGKAYYQHLVRSMVGTDRSMKNILKLLDQTIEDNKNIMSDLLVKDGSIYEKALSVKYPEEEPDKTLQYLKKQIKKSFPDLPSEVSCQMKYVDKSLEEHISPAFYLTTPLDAYQDNVIYLNGNAKYDLTKAFTTIAHEGYPGHLYQNCFYQSQNPLPVRSVVNIGGYTEGWGTYAELYSYSLAGLTKNVASFLKTNTLLTLAIYAKVDLEVNYNGWTEAEVRDYLTDFGYDKTACRTIFDAVVAEPAGYMQYTLGYLEIIDLQKQAKAKWGKQYSDKRFHTFFLSLGEVPFVVARDRLAAS